MKTITTKSNLTSIFMTMTITVLSLLFFIISILFVVGPCVMAYALGVNKNRSKIYGFSDLHALSSMAIGEFTFFIISSFMLKNIFGFYYSEIFWYISITSFLLNYLLSVLFYYLGTGRIKI